MVAEKDAAEFQVETLVTVRRTMLVLEMLADADAGLSLSDLAKMLDVNKSIALRIVSTLEEIDYVYRNVENKRYYAGYKVSNVGLRVLARARLLDQCQPVLRRLATQTGELVLFSVLDREQPRWVVAVTGARRRLQVEPMTSLEYHSTATGKAWLATLPDEDVARILKGRMRVMTPHTIIDVKTMLAHLKEIRRTSISFSNQENEIGIGSIATAIWQQAEGSPRCVGFVSITAPLVRATAEDFERYRGLVLEAARTLGAGWPTQEVADSSDGALVGHGLLVL